MLFDSNIVQRNGARVAGGSGLTGLIASLQGKQLWVNNPYDRLASILIEIQLPDFLKRRGWQISGTSEEGGGKYRLAAGAERIEFASSEIDPSQPNIRVVTLIDGITVGRMSYKVDATLSRRPKDLPCDSLDECCSKGEENVFGLLKCLGIDVSEACIKDVKVSRITLEVDIGKKCHC